MLDDLSVVGLVMQRNDGAEVFEGGCIASATAMWQRGYTYSA